MDIQDSKQENDSLLSKLLQSETAEREDKSGLTSFSGLRITKPSEFVPLDTTSFTSLKDELVLFRDLPKPPTLGSLGFLIKKGASDIREIFEDNWTASCLTYAAAAAIYSRIAKLLEEEKIEEGDEILTLARRLILCASNSPARSLQIYKYIAEKQALRSTPKPGTSREEIISGEEAKAINSKLDSAKKLAQASKSRGRGRGRGPGRTRGFSTYFQQSYYPFPGFYQPYQRGRGQGRGRGRRGGRRGGRQ